MNLDDFIELNKEKGLHWFDADTMKFFKSIIVDWDDDTGYFISSERAPDKMAVRKYTIRKGDFKTGNVNTIGGFQYYGSLHQVKKAFKKICEKEKEIA